MDRRSYLVTLGAAGVAASAGCTTFGGSETLAEPALIEDSPQRRSLTFVSDGEDVATFGVDGAVAADLISLDTELWHRTGTLVDAIRLTVWMPAEEHAGTETVALVAPVQGDSSPPPSVTLSVDRRRSASVVEITDLDDLRDETIDTIGLLVRPRSNPSSTVAVRAEIELAGSGALATDYTLDGRLDLSFPSLQGEA